LERFSNSFNKQAGKQVLRVTELSVRMLTQITRLIQNRRDAPLLLQWGEGDHHVFKILCFPVIARLGKLHCLQEMPGELCIKVFGSWSEELRSIGATRKRTVYELESSTMVAEENYRQVASKYQVRVIRKTLNCLLPLANYRDIAFVEA